MVSGSIAVEPIGRFLKMPNYRFLRGIRKKETKIGCFIQLLEGNSNIRCRDEEICPVSSSFSVLLML
ncbi:hypothetical protein ECG_07580 [Echinococcus granulosus]|uniref:Expressed protein n=1 Tax=Echinococcus granulosus TaxID=6210 RepID=A0A068WVH4_ECHGR|nr:hypothetical protein ECG_07580 [Echinococcus granulosus]CDS24157.1 expressed protein [Echinococcus granulosus]